MTLSIILILGLKYFSAIKVNASVRIIIYTLWIFFSLTYTYYVGAFTMFFVSENGINFKNIKEAISEFPRWNIIFNNGAESHFALPAQRVIILYLCS